VKLPGKIGFVKHFMCGRFSLKASPDDLWKTVAVEPPPGYRPRYNIAPTQPVLAVVLEEGVRRGRMLRWGLVPFWADDPKIGNRMINVRAETVAQKPAFRNAFARRRCVVVTDGFYEWRAAATGKVPYRIQREDGGCFCFAGLWERWDRGPRVVESCAIVTRPADERIAAVHDRMPVMLEGESCDAWLAPASTPDSLQELLRTAHLDGLELYRVSTLVNRPANDVPECLEKVEP
jgi:putative SOS response-associated peptidase YedK